MIRCLQQRSIALHRINSNAIKKQIFALQQSTLLKHRSPIQFVFCNDFSAKSNETKETKDKMEPVTTNSAIWASVFAKHPEIDERENSDILYDYHQRTHFGLMSAGSLAHIAFWSWFKGYEQSLFEMTPAAIDAGSFAWLTNSLGSTLGLGSSIILAFLIGFRARRTVARLSMVKGGKQLRVTTHKFFGDLANPINFPLKTVSANPNMSKFIILKLGKSKGFYLVDVKGKFYNRNMLEKMINFRTDLSALEEPVPDDAVKLQLGLPRTDLESNEKEAKNGKRRKNIGNPVNRKGKRKGHWYAQKSAKKSNTNKSK